MKIHPLKIGWILNGMPIVFGGFRTYYVEEMLQAGVEYHSIGRKPAERVRAKELVQNEL